MSRYDNHTPIGAQYRGDSIVFHCLSQAMAFAFQNAIMPVVLADGIVSLHTRVREQGLQDV